MHLFPLQLSVFDYVYQMPVHEAQHKTDILRSTILLKYGGAYMVSY